MLPSQAHTGTRSGPRRARRARRVFPRRIKRRWRRGTRPSGRRWTSFAPAAATRLPFIRGNPGLPSSSSCQRARPSPAGLGSRTSTSTSVALARGGRRRPRCAATTSPSRNAWSDAAGAREGRSIASSRARRMSYWRTVTHTAFTGRRALQRSPRILESSWPTPWRIRISRRACLTYTSSGRCERHGWKTRAGSVLSTA